MLSFGTITNPKTNETKTLKVNWINANPEHTATYCLGAIFIGIGLTLLYCGAFAAGASAYDNAQDKTFRELGLIDDK